MIKTPQIIILAGGEGKRIWPISSKGKPKQLIKFDSSKSSFQKTILRAQKISKQPPILITTKHLFQEIVKQLKEIHCHDYILLIEPESRNTASATFTAASFILQKQNIQNFLLMPSDHEIANEEEFCLEMQEHLQKLNFNEINIFGHREKENNISSKFGYFYYENQKLNFIEKPPQEYWASLLAKKPMRNSGMISSNAQSLLNEVNQQAQIKFIQIQKNHYEIENLANFSNRPIDRVLLENSDIVNGFELQNAISDIGSFEELMNNFANANQLKIAKNEVNLTDLKFVKDGFEFSVSNHEVIVKKHSKPLKS